MAIGFTVLPNTHSIPPPSPCSSTHKRQAQQALRASANPNPRFASFRFTRPHLLRAQWGKPNLKLKHTRLLTCDCDAHAIRKRALPQSAISCINTLPYTTLCLHHCSTVHISNHPVPGLEPIHKTLLCSLPSRECITRPFPSSHFPRSFPSHSSSHPHVSSMTSMAHLTILIAQPGFPDQQHRKAAKRKVRHRHLLR